MPSSVPAVKKGLRTYLRSWTGLRPDDGVVIRSAPVAPEELALQQVTFGDVTAPQSFVGLAGKAETPTMTCWIRVVRPGKDEDAVDAARDRAYDLLAAVEAAVRADPSAGGTVPPPRRTTVTESALEEGPGEDDQVATRWAQYRFTITWTSHLT